MKKKSIFITFVCTIFLFAHCTTTKSSDSKKKKYIEPSAQRQGNAQKGFDYLMNGNYVSSGIPYDFYKKINPKIKTPLVDRSEINETLPPQFTHVKNGEGVESVAPNCLTCHSDYINGEFVVGLGNTTFDYTANLTPANTLLTMAISSSFGKESPEWQAYDPFRKASKALGNHLQTKVRGINPADKLTAVLVAHRDPVSLEWQEEPQLEIPDILLPTDVPPWWHLKKKHAMFYTAIGRGDFSKFLMASSLLTMQDTIQAQEIDHLFPDVLAWINTLEAPKYPREINSQMAEKGQAIFEKKCSGCHGTYGDKGKYPNYLVALDVVGTDPNLSNAYSSPTGVYKNFIDWYGKSWFTQGDHKGQLIIEEGYVAPPLDGVWATAPYLHNGSVPTVEALLNSEIRPSYWTRTYESTDYNFDALGWNYTEEDSKKGNKTYDTTLPGYKNVGHNFGDKLSQQERMSVIEYLKTL